MAWELSTKRVSDEFSRVNYASTQIWFLVNDLKTRGQSGPVDRVQFRSAQKKLTDALNLFNAAAAVIKSAQGIARVRDELQNNLYDVEANFDAMVTATLTLRNWIHANFTVDAGTGADLTTIVNQDSTTTELKFTTVQLTNAGFFTAANTFLATITPG